MSDKENCPECGSPVDPMITENHYTCGNETGPMHTRRRKPGCVYTKSLMKRVEHYEKALRDIRDYKGNPALPGVAEALKAVACDSLEADDG